MRAAGCAPREPMQTGGNHGMGEAPLMGVRQNASKPDHGKNP